LSLVYELVQLIGGEISVKSKPGRGSVFEFTLPLQAVPVLDIPSTKSEITIDHSLEINILAPYSNNHRIFIPPKSRLPLVLVVEDNLEMRQFIGESLKENYRISEAENGKRGIEKAVELMPDLILSDVMMPELDGVTLSDKLKKDERTS